MDRSERTPRKAGSGGGLEDDAMRLTEREWEALSPFLRHPKGLPEGRLAALAATVGKTGEGAEGLGE